MIIISLIRLEKVSKIYGEESGTIKALDSVNLNIERGKVITIMGPSGSGKSTLLNLIGAMDDPTSGEVFVNDIEIGNLPERKLAEFRKNVVGFVFQNYYLLPNVDVIGNVLIPLVPYRVSKEDRKRAKELLEMVGLGDRIHSKVGKLSGGESQRVAIARALINNPEVILADEPTGNLDSKSGKSIVELLINLSEKGKTVIIVTHDPRIAKVISEHPLGKNIWINDGRFIDTPTDDTFSWDNYVEITDFTKDEETTLNIDEIIEYIFINFEGIVLGEEKGEIMLYYNPQKLLPRGSQFISIKEKDTKNDTFSQLDRSDVFRLNMGISKTTFEKMFGEIPKKQTDGEELSTKYDFSKFDTILPHPIYGLSNRICIVNPSDATFHEQLIRLIGEAYEIAKERFNRRIQK